jgi:hypothetical protein
MRGRSIKLGTSWSAEFRIPERLNDRDCDTTVHPLSFSQQRLWFLDQLVPGSALYNIWDQIGFDGDVDRGALEWAIGEVVTRHEVLRTTFSAFDGRPVQVVSAHCPIPLTFVDLMGLPEPERLREIAHLSDEEVQRPFDLSAGPLLRTTLLRLAAEQYVLLLTIHHIIADGWSMGVLRHEIRTLYEAKMTGAPPPRRAHKHRARSPVAWNDL